MEARIDNKITKERKPKGMQERQGYNHLLQGKCLVGSLSTDYVME